MMTETKKAMSRLTSQSYMVLLVETDRDLLRGDGEQLQSGTVIAYDLQYPSYTEIMAHLVYASRWLGTPIEIVSKEDPRAQKAKCLLPATEVALDPVGWITSGWGSRMRGYRRMLSQIRSLRIRLLPRWPESSTSDARKYWTRKRIESFGPLFRAKKS